jgi:HD-GYP domain-containing protein (c-di-GMP phosphodiesterase class II)
VHQHHERWNGSGYPRGLAGEAILLEARIVAVADVVEAMCSNRPHRAAVGLDAAMDEIQRNAGQLYDKRVVDACVQLFFEKGFKWK